MTSERESEQRVDLSSYFRRLPEIETRKVSGRVCRAAGLVIESAGPPAAVGETLEVYSDGRGTPILSEVIGFRDKTVISMPIYEPAGVRIGDRVVSRRIRPDVPVGRTLLGRVIDGSGDPLDGRGPVPDVHSYPLTRQGRNPLNRRRITKPLGTGVRAVDGLLPVGRGQRIGIFGGSGVGKSTLLGMMARYTEASVSVISLVGERGREVNEFIEKDLGEEGMKRSVVVVSTSDNPPLMRIRAALAATAVAEYFADQGEDVLFVMDSVTRVAMAQREVGLAAAEPPSSKGYTPSVFALLPRLFERAGNFEKGSITGFYTVLVEGDEMNEPVADAVRGLLDGHIVLSRELGWKGHYPAIDVLSSISRLMDDLSEAEQVQAAAALRQVLSTYLKAEDMINIGAYTKGSNRKVDEAIARIDAVQRYLRQGSAERVAREEAIGDLCELFRS